MVPIWRHFSFWKHADERQYRDRQVRRNQAG